jgi:hypothetical protein
MSRLESGPGNGRGGRLGGTERLAWILSGLGLLIALGGLLFAPHALFIAWLASCAAWIGWPIGSMALILVHALTGGRWGIVIRPALRAGVATLPLLLPALVLLLAGSRQLYPWLARDPMPALTNGFYLNAPFALLRIVVDLVVWGGLAVLCLRGRDLQRIAPAGLILLALTFSFAAIDLTESLDPRFNSSAYGMVAMAGAGLLALSIGILLASFRAPVEDLRDLARLLLGLTILWAYLDFVQFLIVWQSNLPSEAPWYRVRIEGGWGVAAVAIMLLHFLLPFALLALSPLQRRRGVIRFVAGLLVAMEVIRNLWLVLPAQRQHSALLDLACILVFAAAAAALARRRGVLDGSPAHGVAHV